MTSIRTSPSGPLVDAGGETTDDVLNVSVVSGVSLTDALDALAPAAIPSQTALANNAAAPALPAATTIHQMLDWISGSTQWVFTGPSQSAQAGNVLNVNPNTAFTIGIWVDSAAFAASEAIRKFDASGRGYALLFETTGKTRFFLSTAFAGGLFAEIESSGTIVSGRHLITASIDTSGTAGGMEQWIDGVLQGATIIANALGGGPTTNTATFQIGGFGSSSTRVLGAFFIAGKLNATQQAEVYNGGIPPNMNALPTTPAPLVWYQFNAADTVAPGGIVDYSASHFNATAAGGLAPTSTIGSLAVRGPSLWQTISDVAAGIPLVAGGVQAVPIYALLTTAGIAAVIANAAIQFAIRVACPSGGGAGTPDDVIVFNANAPFSFRILRAEMRVSTSVGGSSAALRTALAGGGTVVLPDAAVATRTFATAAQGYFSDAALATATVAALDTLVLRRSDRSVVGELVLYCMKI